MGKFGTKRDKIEIKDYREKTRDMAPRLDVMQHQGRRDNRRYVEFLISPIS